MAEQLQQLILDLLDKSSVIENTQTITIPGETSPATSNESQLVIQGALNSLLSREMVTYTAQETLTNVLTPEGLQIAEKGSHEAVVWAALPLKGQGTPLNPKQLKEAVGDDVARIGQGKAFKSGWIGKEGDGLVKLLPSIVDVTQNELIEIRDTGSVQGGEKAINELRKRRLVTQKKGIWFSVQKGPNFSTSTAKPETDLTSEMLQSGTWKTATFKKYNFEAEGVPPNGGALHPLLKVREEFRNIFMEMG
ncbi:Phenylalanyl-tRNA synthetase, beta subunit, cytoplasmic [Tulasnella sp. 418]|nr:Phenylalanyl-tRNA synthetase, beta subunit, cytoplasmic [Tulasnella sp. 418]